MNRFELSILDFIRENLTNPFLDTVMPFITRFGDGGVFWIVLSVLLIIFKRTRRMGVCMGLSLLIGFITGNLLLKNIIARIRPYDINTEIEILVKHLSDYSFPSGHTLASFEAATAITLNNKKWGVFALILAFLIALSRLYLYVHYPSDVIFGAVLGVAIAFLAKYIIDKADNRFSLTKRGII